MCPFAEKARGLSLMQTVVRVLRDRTFLVEQLERKQKMSDRLTEVVQVTMIGWRVFVILFSLTGTRMTVWRARNMFKESFYPCSLVS